MGVGVQEEENKPSFLKLRCWNSGADTAPLARCSDPPASAKPPELQYHSWSPVYKKACLRFVNLGNMNGDVDTVEYTFLSRRSWFG